MGIEKLASLVGSASKYLGKAVTARERFYRGLDEAAHKAFMEDHPNMGEDDAKYRFGQSVVGKQLINDNKWHMAQSRTFSLMAIAHGIFVLVQEQKQSNVLLKEVRDAVRRSGNPGRPGRS